MSAVVPSIEFPVNQTVKDEIKPDGTLLQSNETNELYGRPTAKWSGARSARAHRHHQKFEEMHVLYYQDKCGWDAPAPDFVPSGTAIATFQEMKKTYTALVNLGDNMVSAAVRCASPNELDGIIQHASTLHALLLEKSTLIQENSILAIEVSQTTVHKAQTSPSIATSHDVKVAKAASEEASARRVESIVVCTKANTLMARIKDGQNNSMKLKQIVREAVANPRGDGLDLDAFGWFERCPPHIEYVGKAIAARDAPAFVEYVPAAFRQMHQTRIADVANIVIRAADYFCNTSQHMPKEPACKRER